MQYFFFSCYFCGSFYYSTSKIKSKTCFQCNKTFQFAKTCWVGLELPFKENASDLLKGLKEMKRDDIIDIKKALLELQDKKQDKKHDKKKKKKGVLFKTFRPSR